MHSSSIRYLFLLLACCITLQSLHPTRVRADEASAPAKQTKITISKETTRVLGPLDAQGYVDYVAAINALASEDVTPENNAAVLLWQAWGPEPIPEAARRKFFEQLGTEPLPNRGKYFSQFSDLYAKLPNSFDQQQKAMVRPWKKDEHPKIAAWLEENAGALELVIVAGQRAKLFKPVCYVNAEPTLNDLFFVDTDLATVSQQREFVNALRMRAMLHAGSRNIRLAWQDLLTCYRLGQLNSVGSLLDRAVAVATTVQTSETLAALLHFSKPSREQLRQMQADLDKLGVVSAPQDHWADRLESLNLLQGLARYEPDFLAELILIGRSSQLNKPQSEMLAKLARQVHSLIDWNRAMHDTNHMYNQFDAAAKLATYRERKSALDELYAKLEANDLDLGKLLAQLDPATKPSQELADRLSRHVTSSLLLHLRTDLLSSRSSAQSRFAPVLIALAAYRADHARYPKSLDELVPGYLAELPNDPFEETQPIRAQLWNQRAVIYVVGPNMRDDRGQGYTSERMTDDVTVALPPELPRPLSTGTTPPPTERSAQPR